MNNYFQIKILQEMKLSILTVMKVVIVFIKVKYGGVKQVNGVVKQCNKNLKIILNEIIEIKLQK